MSTAHGYDPRSSTAALLTALDAALCAPSTASGVPDLAPSVDEAVRDAVQAYASAHDGDWKRFAFWGKDHYVRNLVSSTASYEVLIITWAPGQGSRVHNHGVSQCWMTCLSGAVEELCYSTPAQHGSSSGASNVPVSPSKHKLRLPGVLADESPCPALQLLRATVVPSGSTAFINDAVGIHAVRCAGPDHAPSGGVTLHVYSPPIAAARLYEPEWDRVSVRKPGHVSERGNLVAFGGSANTVVYGPAPTWHAAAEVIALPYEEADVAPSTHEGAQALQEEATAELVMAADPAEVDKHCEPVYAAMGGIVEALEAWAAQMPKDPGYESKFKRLLEEQAEFERL